MRLLKRGRGFARNRRGVTAITFALCLIPILMMSGFAIDFALHLTYKKKVQHALDMAGLAAARHLNQDMGADLDTIKRLARSHFQSELGGADYISLNQVDVTRTGMRINLEVDGTMPTSIMHLAGVPTMSLFTESEAVYGVPSKAEIALVLDTSISMTNIDTGATVSRLEAVQDAAIKMVDDLVDPDDGADIKMAIVPFGSYVNVGRGNRNEAWISIPADWSEVITRCDPTADWLNRRCEPISVSCDQDDTAQLCEDWDCHGLRPSRPEDQECTTSQRNFEWHGCVQPRTGTSHLQDDFYDTVQIPGLLTLNSFTCSRPMLPMTDDVDSLTGVIRRLTAENETYIPSGLIWGLRMLTANDPFPAEKSIPMYMSEGGLKSIVLMSDGANWLVPDATGELVEDPTGTVANANTLAVCQTIQQTGVEIYVVAYDITDLTTTELLQECASSESRFYAASSTDELQEVFAAIAKQLGRDVSISG